MNLKQQEGELIKTEYLLWVNYYFIIQENVQHERFVFLVRVY